ncbi:MAG: hypothetical protein R3C61_00520 [Bacteroidia bacterium]
MKQSWLFFLIPITGGILNLFACSASKPIPSSDEPQQATYTFLVLPEHEIVEYHAKSGFSSGFHYFRYTDWWEVSRTRGERCRLPYSEETFFWQNDTLFDVFPRLGNRAMLTKSMERDTILFMYTYISLAGEKDFLRNRKAFQYRIHYYPIDPTSFLEMTYLEGVGFIRAHSQNPRNPKYACTWELIKINGVKLKKFLRRHKDFALIVE